MTNVLVSVVNIIQSNKVIERTHELLGFLVYCECAQACVSLSAPRSVKSTSLSHQREREKRARPREREKLQRDKVKEFAIYDKNSPRPYPGHAVRTLARLSYTRLPHCPPRCLLLPSLRAPSPSARTRTHTYFAFSHASTPSSHTPTASSSTSSKYTDRCPLSATPL